MRNETLTSLHDSPHNAAHDASTRSIGRVHAANGRHATTAGRAFTLVEILIVVAILGILAALVIPQFSSAAATTRESSIRMDLNRIRAQIEIYRQQHTSTPPSLANFADQMTRASNDAGQTAAVGTEGYRYGPYFMYVPINPSTNTRTVTDGAVGTSAWYYNETTGDFRANDSEASRLY